MVIQNHGIYYNSEQTSHRNEEAEPAEPGQMNIYQGNTYRTDLSWLHFNYDSRVQLRQQV